MGKANYTGKKELRFVIAFISTLLLLTFYLGTSITGNVVRFGESGQIITHTPVPKVDIIFYAIVTLTILSMGGYYFLNKKELIPPKNK